MWTMGIVQWHWDTPPGEIYNLSLTLSITPSPTLHLSVCVSLSLSSTQNYTLTITPRRATKDTPNQASHTHAHHTQGMQWLPRTIDTWTQFFSWEISGPPHPHNPIRVARQTEDCKDAPPALPSRVLFQEKADSRIRTTFTGCQSHLQVQKRGHRKAQVMLYSVCVSFISLNEFRNPGGTQWLSPTTPK